MDDKRLLQYGTSYLDIASYGEYPADFRADEDFVQLNFFEAISASVLFVDGIVKNQQKNRNKLYVTSPKKNTNTNSTALCSYRGSLLREFGEFDDMDIAIASMFIV